MNISFPSVWFPLQVWGDLAAWRACSLRESMAELHSAASSCVQTGNTLIADHSGFVCKLTEPNISEARRLCCSHRAPSSFSLRLGQICWKGAARLTSPQPHQRANRRGRAILIFLSPQCWGMPSSNSRALASHCLPCGRQVERSEDYKWKGFLSPILFLYWLWSGATVCTLVPQYNLNRCTADAMTTHNSICNFKIAFNAQGLIWL